jgi:acetyltransferase-like isoleucine patch superfamily enzyme
MKTSLKLIGEVGRSGVVALVTALGTEAAVRYLRNPDPRLSARVLRKRGAQVGTRTRFKRSLFLDNTVESSDCAGDFRNLRIGANCYIGDMVYLDLAAPIEIADDAVVSGNVSIITHSDCNRSQSLAQLFPRKTAAVRLGRGCWIGASAVLLAGVEIGSRAVVAAGSVVTSNVPADTLYAGVPARRVRGLTFASPAP